MPTAGFQKVTSAYLLQGHMSDSKHKQKFYDIGGYRKIQNLEYRTKL